ncbi:MAG: mobilome CxxCx(11)CxxC protein [Thermoleophilia bacterium]|jgi:mobilome CxxCx(11)CxxC protein
MSNEKDKIPNERRGECAEEALRSFGTAYIFEKRAKKIRWKVTSLTFFGIAVPASVGAVIATYNISSENLKYIVYTAGSLAFIQLLLSIWSLSSCWNQKLAYYLESKSANYRLADRFDSLGKTTLLTAHDFDTEFRVLKNEAEMRTVLDYQHDVSDREKRMGMRSALRRFQRPCPECNEVPTSMKSTNCHICGNFKKEI